MCGLIFRDGKKDHYYVVYTLAASHGPSGHLVNLLPTPLIASGALSDMSFPSVHWPGPPDIFRDWILNVQISSASSSYGPQAGWMTSGHSVLFPSVCWPGPLDVFQNQILDVWIFGLLDGCVKPYLDDDGHNPQNFQFSWPGVPEITPDTLGTGKMMPNT
jgi:hypothetical protein